MAKRKRVNVDKGGLTRAEAEQQMLETLARLQAFQPTNAQEAEAKAKALAGIQQGIEQNRQLVDPSAARVFLKAAREKFGPKAQVQVTQDSDGEDVFSVIAPDTKANRKKAKTLGRRKGNKVSFMPQGSQIPGAPGPLGTPDAPTTPIDDLIRQTDEAQKEARKANEDRFEEIKSGRLKFLETLLGGIKGLGKKAMADILRREKSQIGAIGQDLIDRGISSTTVRGNLLEGVRRETEGSLLGLNESLRRDLLGALTTGSEQFLSFLERRTDVGPDMGPLTDLARQAGEFGAGDLTGTPPPGLQRRGAGGGAQALPSAPQLGGGGFLSPEQQEELGPIMEERRRKQEELDAIEEVKILRSLPPGQSPPNPNEMINGRVAEPLPPGATWEKQGNVWVLMQRPTAETQRRLDLEEAEGSDFSRILDSAFDDLFGGGAAADVAPLPAPPPRQPDSVFGGPPPRPGPVQTFARTTGAAPLGGAPALSQAAGAQIGAQGLSRAGAAPGAAGGFFPDAGPKAAPRIGSPLRDPGFVQDSDLRGGGPPAAPFFLGQRGPRPGLAGRSSPMLDRLERGNFNPGGFTGGFLPAPRLPSKPSRINLQRRRPRITTFSA